MTTLVALILLIGPYNPMRSIPLYRPYASGEVLTTTVTRVP